MSSTGGNGDAIAHNLNFAGEDIQIPVRKERKTVQGLFGSLGRKIRSSFRGKTEEKSVISTSEESKQQSTKSKQCKKKRLKCVEKSIVSSSTSDDISDALLGHNNESFKTSSCRSSKCNKREPTRSVCSSASRDSDHLSSQAASLTLNPHDTSDSSADRMNSLNVASDSSFTDEPILVLTGKSTCSSKVSANRTYSSIHPNRDCPLLPQCLCFDGNMSSSSNYESIDESVLLIEPFEKNRANRTLCSSNVNSVEKPAAGVVPVPVPALAPDVPPHPDILPVSTSTPSPTRSISTPSPTRSRLSSTFGGHSSTALTLTDLLSSAGLVAGSINASNNGMFEFGFLAEQERYRNVHRPSEWSLTRELLKLSNIGWYWGPLSRVEAEEKLYNQFDGTFLVRDSSDDRYLLSLSFRSNDRTLHTRIEHLNGKFSFYAQPGCEGFSSIVELIEHSMDDSKSGIFCYSRARTPGSPMFPVRLTKPVSRFSQVRSLQYMCRFVIRQYTRLDHIHALPLPNKIKHWLEENQY